MMLVIVLVMWFAATGVLIFLQARQGILASFREPVLRRPVLIVESDDWGAGAVGQAEALQDIAGLLGTFNDIDGHHPVMTLGVVLATADGEKTLSSGSYHRVPLSPQTHGALLDAINHGVDSGVFSVQLHGMEHFWPPALMLACSTDDAVVDWLRDAPHSRTEDLPSPLQSRWVDASSLPARRLAREAVRKAVREEVGAFRDVFGCLPFVVVPPTFVWNEDVEHAWAANGVGVIVTPGARYESRAVDGRPAGRGGLLYNGQTAVSKVIYLVRDVYFEPLFGHTGAQALAALADKTGLGRPALFETHRFNFLGTDQERSRSLKELKRLLQLAVDRFPELAFLSSGELAEILARRPPEWVERRWRRRLHVWISRLARLPRLRKLGWLTGWILPVGLLWRMTA
jgi:hypothetical protein